MEGYKCEAVVSNVLGSNCVKNVKVCSREAEMCLRNGRYED